MKKIYLFFLLFLNISLTSIAQNVGINATGALPDVSAGLDVGFTNKGFLAPRVALTATNAAGPIATPATGLLVYNTATAGIAPDNVIPGYYYNSGTSAAPIWKRLATTGAGDAWNTLGNSGTAPATNFLGTTDAQDLVFRTTNIERMRISTGAAGAGYVGINIAPSINYQLYVSSTVTGIYGASTGASTYGVLGTSNAATGFGVDGFNSNASGTGVIGSGNNIGAQYLTGGSGGAFSSTNVGVFGYGNNTAGSYGVYGQTINATGIGVLGQATINTATGVFAWNSAANGTAVGFGIDARSGQSGGAAIMANLQSASYFSGTAISAFTLSTVAGGRGVLAACDNATGIGVQGQTSGAGASTGVVGISSGANVAATGVYGLASATTAGTGFVSTNCRKGVYGQGNSAAGSYRFGVFGNGGTSIRSGGVIGDDYGIKGALGYFASNSVDYAVYGFGGAYQTGAAGGFINPVNNDPELYASTNTNYNYFKKSRSVNNDDDDVNFYTWSEQKPNTTIGLGIYGGVMGGWIKGLVYGTNLSGAKYGVYVHGKTITNGIIATLNEVGGADKRVATYAPSAMKVDITERGRAKMINGKATVVFSEAFSQLISREENITITVTPLGASKGVYIESSSENGFIVIENEGGTSTVEVNWIAIGVKKGFENPGISPEILADDFEEKINGSQGVMYNDNNPANPIHSIWYDGTNVRFDRPTNKKEEMKPQVEYIAPLDLPENSKLKRTELQSIEKIEMPKN